MSERVSEQAGPKGWLANAVALISESDLRLWMHKHTPPMGAEACPPSPPEIFIYENTLLLRLDFGKNMVLKSDKD